MGLQEALQAEAGALLAGCPEETLRRFEQSVAALREAGVLDEAVHTGEMVPDFRLADESGRSVSLQEALDRGPVAILWLLSPGSPVCRRTLFTYRQALRPLLDDGASLLAISLWTAEQSADAGVGAGGRGFHLLGDPDGKVAALFGVLYAPPPALIDVFRRLDVHPAGLADGRSLLPLACSYVVDGDGIAAFAHLEIDPTRRADPALTLEAMHRLVAAP